MKVIVFIAILGLALAGLRGDKRKVPHSIPHRHHAVPHSIPHHQHSSHHASKTSGHGHGSSNSENSEELFNLLGALEGGLDNIAGDLQGVTDSVAISAPTATATSENSAELFSVAAAIQDGIANAIQGTTDTITSDLQGTADTINGALQSTAATICNNVQGVLCDDAEGTADTIGGDLVGTADTLTPIINATGSDTAYATQKLNTTQVVDDVNDGVSTIETGLNTAGDVMHIVQKGLSIASAAGAFSFVDLGGIIENDIQGTIDTIQGDIQGTVDTIQGDLQGTANTVTKAVESITPAEAAATGNAIASTIGTGLVIGNDALKDVNDGLSIANSVIP